MPSPTTSWNLVRVYGTWRGMDGVLKAGTYKVTIPARITNVTDDAIIPAGQYASGALQTTVGGSPSLDVLVPATDDPDNAETGWKITITVSFPDAASEAYVIDVPVAARPTPDGGSGIGVNLRTCAMPTVIPQQVALYKVGVPGGLAQLDSVGQVIDSDGNPVTGGGAVDSVNGQTGVVAITKADIGLGSVDNTTDAAKPVSTAQATAIGAKYTKPGTGVPSTDLATAVQTSLGKADTAVQPAGLTKAAVGLGSVDNTADSAKPVSTAQQTALDLKAPLASPTFTGTVAGVTKTHVGLGNVDNTSDANKPISTATQTALNAKGTSNLAIGTTGTTAKVGNYAPTLADIPAGSILAAPLDGSVNTSAGLARPSSRTDIFFRWRSTVQPTNMLTGDEWLVAP